MKSAFSSATPSLEIKNNVLKVISPVDSQAVFLQLRDRFAETETVINNTSSPIVLHELNGWQWFQVWVGRILLLIFIVLILIKFLRNG